MTTLPLGTPAPDFTAPTTRQPRFNLGVCGGRYVVLAFLPADAARREAMVQAAAARADLFHDARMILFFVARETEVFEKAREGQGVRWFHDPDGAIAGRYGVRDADGATRAEWILIDPTLRLLAWRTGEEAAGFLAELASLPAPDDHAGTVMHAPVLIVPRIFEPDICRRLIAFYEADGGSPSGVMRQVDGRTVGMLDDYKKRRDATITDTELLNAVQARLSRRLLPEIKKAFQFQATRIERFIVACYKAEDGGYFRPHRDDTTSATAHRKFAVSMNLNAEAFEGGDLRFPEFGSRTYRPPSGGAVVFSCSLLHEATPVTRGVRYAFLPFLYDEAGAEVRKRNQHLLETAPPAA